MILDKIVIDFRLSLTAGEATRSSRVASAAAVAGRGGWTDAVKEPFYNRAAFHGNSPDDGPRETCGTPWDCILGAELVRHYNLIPSIPICRRLLDLEPAEVMMVALIAGLRAAKVWDCAPRSSLGPSSLISWEARSRG